MKSYEEFRFPTTFVLSFVITSMLFNGAYAQENITNPQFVLVPGIGHGGWAFAQVITCLQEAGYSAFGVDLTSQGINKVDASEVETIDEYVKPLTDLFETITKPVIIVGHSLGGGSISVMMEKFPEKISKAVFLTSIMPTNQQTFFNSLPQSVLTRLLEANQLIPEGNPPTSVSINVSSSPTFLYNRTPRWAITLASTLLNPTPYRPGDESISLTPQNYGRVRRFYIRTGSDLAIRPEEQTQIIKANPPERVYSLALSDHAPFLSQPYALCNILLSIARIPLASTALP
ncbi:hypothetical protein MPTK1_7g01390 [Marchantia polymorpha subsp. ruderalis]|uniref:AB hydrolase-1 domain-containing protein n=2 Tax=Marchantia polymorpha TaxID=3197 RepID=A0A176WQR2_MARPO|nr:hypothetical protein AXG93_2528s2340 [Marchantia polymorpha subsp. ruderalis]PTQ32374.1 hypothetical protein MARPO_0099s0013 [Marchantia polymorpha]BBN15846.1 hypothetical protein Mp_7g01390 [Marchantia polymorpha subsp. ruderalis]|eukprot:PTQ32374.1 hypothetical protein MARPO_0099s0013 [Marchantia polymorpha]